MNNKKKRRFGFVLALILAAVLQISVWRQCMQPASR